MDCAVPAPLELETFRCDSSCSPRLSECWCCAYARGSMPAGCVFRAILNADSGAS